MAATEESIRSAIIKELARREMQRRQQSERVEGSREERLTGEFRQGPNAPVAASGRLTGVLETGAQMAAGAVLTPIAGIVGLIEGTARAAVPGGGDFGSATDTVNRIISFGFQPRTEEGQEISQAVMQPFERVELAVDRLAENLGRGNPIASTAIKTLILGAPEAFGTRRIRITRNKIRSDIRRIEQQARELGIEIGPTIREDIADAARDVTTRERGESMIAVQERLRELKENARSDVRAKYESARTTQAELQSSSLNELNVLTRESLSDFDTQMMPTVRQRLDEINALQEQGLERSVFLGEIETIRQRINQNKPPRVNGQETPEGAALNRLRGTIDEWLDDQFNRDMIRGDEGALQAWKDARAASASYRRRFSDNKVIRQFIDEEATIEQMRKWVFGASRAGFKQEAALVLNRLKELLGEDSPQFQALRQEALFDIVEPLVREDPNLAQFNARYDRMARDNPSVMRELAIESQTPLKRLRELSGAAVKTGVSPALNFDLARAVSQITFGHSIARRGLQVRMATTAIKALQRAGTNAQKRALYREMLGYDPQMPVMPRSGPAAAAVIVGEMEQAKRLRREEARQ